MKYSLFRIGYAVILVFMVSFFVSCNEKARISDESNQSDIVNNYDEIPVYNFEELEPFLYTETDKTYIVNFWAMWCAPCVKELPHIEEYAKNNKDVEVLLVSLDFPKEIETKLKPFLKEKNINSKVILLDDPASNIWIDKINPDWSGAIPFTIIFNKKERLFYEGEFEDIKDLENEVNKILN